MYDIDIFRVQGKTYVNPIQAQPFPLRIMKILSQVVGDVICQKILPPLREIWRAACHFDIKLLNSSQVVEQAHELLEEQPRFEFVFLCLGPAAAKRLIPMIKPNHF